jgi:hypothetical protein
MLWVVAGLGAVAAVLVWRWAMAPAENELDSPDSVPTLLRHLLGRGISGGELRIQVKGYPERRLVFTKYIVSQNNVGCRCAFSCNCTGTDDCSPLRDELNQRHIRYAETQDEGGVPQIVVDCGHDVGLSHVLVNLVFERVFDVRTPKHCVAFLKGVLISPEPSLTGMDDTGV